ncbi:MAG: type II secretion system F family protein [Candidatus Margulisbacteria bacterium]|nr:type II secretion system F family protein [Candidatus Margulisiibacteriota bacterium]
MKPKKRKTSPKYLRVTFSLALLALVAAGFYYLGSLQRDPQTTSSDNLLKVKLFYYNQRADKVASVERTIPLSQAPIKETINLLLKGELSPQEKSQGFSTEFPHPEFKLLGAALKNGQLALMFKSKIPLVQSLHSIAEQTKNPTLREKILIISQEVEGGTRFSQALSVHPRLFSSFYISMVKSGETSGTLSDSLTYLADHLEREYYLNSKIQGAMIYPALIVVVVVGVLVMMMYFVIPNMTKVLTESGQDLPLVTEIVIALSNFMMAWGWLVFLLSIGLGAAFVRYSKTVDGKRIKDTVYLRIPFVNSFLRMIYITR